MSRILSATSVAAALTFAATTGFILPGGAAQAASPTYCALYGREYAVATVQPGAAPGMLQSVQDQAYYRCLNQDEDPPLPQTSAYFGKDATDAAPALAPVPAVEASAVIVTPPKPNLAPSPAPAQAAPARETASIARTTTPAPRATPPPSTPPATTAFASTANAGSPSLETSAYAPVPATDAPAPAPKQKSALSALVDMFFPQAPPAAPTQDKPAQAPQQVAQGSTYAASYHGSSRTPWTPEWKAWCARNFPNSWDPKTGTILNYGADKRELCR